MTSESGPGREGPTTADLLELMSVLAHDLRTPLTPVRGYAEILRTKPELGPIKSVQYATIIVEAAARIERSVDMLSGISTLYSGRAEVRSEALRPVDIVAERLDLWRGRHPERVFAADTEEAHGPVVADRGWLGRALDVLIEHAVRAWPSPAVISLSARTDAEAVATCFSADGVSSPDVTRASYSDRLGRAFVIAVSDVCGYPLNGDYAIDVPAAQPRHPADPALAL
ncbi:MAG: histidine kinase dimerization/phospho-acceptor domain-containing protein [Actinomycetota bacterium]